jgi:DNA/RNA endonuclease G (NUC1)
MAHAGTMVGGSAQTKQSGSPWPAIALAVAVIVATIAGVWLASSAGLIGGTAKPVANQSYDQYLNSVLDRAHAAPYAGGAVTLPSAASQARNDYLNGIFERAHAAPYAGAAITQARSDYLKAIFDRAHAARYAAGAASQARNDYLNGILDRAHAAPYVGGK